MIPTSFQSKENGGWQRWTGSTLNMLEINRRADPDNENIYINGVLVYCLSFVIKTDEKGTPTEIQRWNCRTGWEKKGML